MKEKFLNIYKLTIYLFAFGSSVYCMNLLINKLVNSNNISISFSFFICIFILGSIIAQKNNN